MVTARPTRVPRVGDVYLRLTRHHASTEVHVVTEVDSEWVYVAVVDATGHVDEFCVSRSAHNVNVYKFLGNVSWNGSLPSKTR